MTGASNTLSQHSNLSSSSRSRLADDESWRKPGIAFRSNLVRLDTKKNAFQLKADCSIERYYQVADRVLEAFLQHSIDSRGELIEAYLIGSRLVHFLTTILPTHPKYFSHRPSLTKLRDQAQAQLVELTGYIDVMAMMLDRQEHERYISYVLGSREDGGSRASADPTAEADDEEVNINNKDKQAMAESMSAQNDELQDWSVSLESTRPLLHDDWDSSWIKQQSRMYAILDQDVSVGEEDSKLEDCHQSAYTQEGPIPVQEYLPLAESPPRGQQQQKKQQQQHQEASSSPQSRDEWGFVTRPNNESLSNWESSAAADPPQHRHKRTELQHDITNTRYNEQNEAYLSGKHQDVFYDDLELQFYDDDEPSQSFGAKVDDALSYEDVYYKVSSPVSVDSRHCSPAPDCTSTSDGMQKQQLLSSSQSSLNVKPRETPSTSRQGRRAASAVESVVNQSRPSMEPGPLDFGSSHRNFSSHSVDIEPPVSSAETFNDHYSEDDKRIPPSQLLSRRRLANGITTTSPHRLFDPYNESHEGSVRSRDRERRESVLSVERQYHDFTSDNFEYEERRPEPRTVSISGRNGESVRHSLQRSHTSEESLHGNDRKVSAPRNSSRLYVSPPSEEKMIPERSVAPKSLLWSSFPLESDVDNNTAASSKCASAHDIMSEYDEREPRFVVNITVDGKECVSVPSAVAKEQAIPSHRQSSVLASAERLKAIRSRRLACQESLHHDADPETESAYYDGYENQLKGGQGSYEGRSAASVDKPNNAPTMESTKNIGTASRQDGTPSRWNKTARSLESSTYVARDFDGPSVSNSSDKECDTSISFHTVEHDSVLNGEVERIILHESMSFHSNSKGPTNVHTDCKNSQNRGSKDESSFDPFSEGEESEPCDLVESRKRRDAMIEAMRIEQKTHLQSSPPLGAPENRKLHPSQRDALQKYQSRRRGLATTHSQFPNVGPSVRRRGSGPVDLDETVEDVDGQMSDVGLTRMASLSFRPLSPAERKTSISAKTRIEQRMETASAGSSHASPTSVLDLPVKNRDVDKPSTALKGVFGEEDDDTEMVNAFLVRKRRPMSSFRGCVRFLLE